MRWIKKIGLVCGGILIVLLILYVLPWKSRINTTINGAQCKIGESKYIEKVTITIKGDYKRYLFKKDTFSGRIELDNRDFTLADSKVSLEFHDNKSFLLYQNVVGGNATQDPLGTIYCSSDFKKILICIYEEIGSATDYANIKSYTWDAENGLFFSAPALNREEAIRIAKDLAEESINGDFR